MPDFEMITVSPRHYFYVAGRSSMNPDDISAVMAEGFGKVMAFVIAQGIRPQSMPMAAYHDGPQEGVDGAMGIAFQMGVFVSEADAARAAGDIQAGATPAGRALHFTHVGPYATLRDSYGAAMAHITEEGLTIGAPSWEIYVDDPGEIPEADLRTEITMMLG